MGYADPALDSVGRLLLLSGHRAARGSALHSRPRPPLPLVAADARFHGRHPPRETAPRRTLARALSSRPAQHRAPLLAFRSEEHTSELQSLMRISYAVFCLKKKKLMYEPIYDVRTNCKATTYKRQCNIICTYTKPLL